MDPANLPGRSSESSLRPLSKITGPPRASTAPLSKKAHLHSLHHHKHHHQHHSTRDAIQSAIQINPPASFSGILKSGIRSSADTPEASVRGQSPGPLDEVSELLKPDPVRPEDVLRERQLEKTREKELQKLQQSLSELSMATTRRLDDTYYSILEKVSNLRSMIDDLHNLSSFTKNLQHDFGTDSEGLQRDIQGQIDDFGDFKEQQKRIEDMESRVKTSKEKADELKARLEAARARVEAREKSEGESQAKASRRFRIFWIIFAGVLALIIALVVSRSPESVEEQAATPIFSPLQNTNRSELEMPTSPRDFSDKSLRADATLSVSGTAGPEPDVGGDPVLHAFDEL